MAVLTLAIVGCGKSKALTPRKAADLYTGELFKSARRYAEQHCDHWVIASAKHGLVLPGTKLEPYERQMPAGQDDKRAWAFRAQADLQSIFERLGIRAKGGQYRQLPRVVMLAGKDYIEPLLKWTFLGRYLDLVDEPLKGLGIGERISWLRKYTDGPTPDSKSDLHREGEDLRTGAGPGASVKPDRCRAKTSGRLGGPTDANRSKSR